MVSLQKKLAAKILKCSPKRVWVDPTSPKIRQAITRKDIRRLVKDGLIKKMHAKILAKNEPRRQQFHGSRKGAKGARVGKKAMWLRIVRPQRRLLTEIKPTLKPGVYRKLYLMVKGNAFRSKAHLNSYIEENEMAKRSK